MSLSNASLFTGATVAPTGGSALAFTSGGISAGVNPLYCTADDDLRTRREVICTTKAPKVSASAPNGYTQQRAAANIKFPLELDNGNITINTLRIELSCDVETTSTEKDEYMSVGAQLLCDADFTEFFQNLSLA